MIILNKYLKGNILNLFKEYNFSDLKFRYKITVNKYRIDLHLKIKFDPFYL